MKEILRQEIAIYRSKESVWSKLIQIDEFGHYWLPQIAAIIKKTDHGYVQDALFSISHFQGSSLCCIEQIDEYEKVVFSIVGTCKKQRLTYVLVEDGNSIQLTATVECEITGFCRLFSPFIYWQIRRAYKSQLVRFRKLCSEDGRDRDDILPSSSANILIQ